MDDYVSQPSNLEDGMESDDSDWGLEDPSTAESLTRKKSTIVKGDMDRLSLKTVDTDSKRTKSVMHIGEVQGGGCFSCFSLSK